MFDEPWLKSLEAFILRVMSKVDYHAMFEAKVISQDAQGNLAIEFFSPKMPSMTGVEIRYGVPGIKAEVKAGATVLVGFVDGEPTKPYATIWRPESINKLIVDSENFTVKMSSTLLGDAAILGVARATDPVAVGDPVVPVMASFVLPSVPPPTSPIPVQLLAGVPVPIYLVTPIQGQIVSGSLKVKAEL